MPKNLSTDTGSIESGHIEPIKVWISAACGKTGRTNTPNRWWLALLRTYHEPISRPRSPRSSTDAGNRCRSVFARLLSPVFPGLESWNLNHLVLIPFCFSRAKRAAGALCSLLQIEFRPDDRKRPDQMVDVLVAVHRRGRQAQPLSAARHCRVVDRLHIDLELVEQPVANLPAQYRAADDDRHDMARIIAVRDLCGIEPAAQLRGALVQLAAFDGAVFQMADAGQGGRRHGRRQRRREDEAGSKAAHEIAQRRRTDDIAADDAEGFRQCALDNRQPAAHAVALGNAAAARPVEPDRMHLVAIGHRPMRLRDVA